MLGGYSNQKLSALMRQLVADGLVKKVVDKKKSYFSAIMPVEASAEENEDVDYDFIDLVISDELGMFISDWY